MGEPIELLFFDTFAHENSEVNVLLYLVTLQNPVPILLGVEFGLGAVS